MHDDAGGACRQLYVSYGFVKPHVFPFRLAPLHNISLTRGFSREMSQLVRIDRPNQSQDIIMGESMHRALNTDNQAQQGASCHAYKPHKSQGFALRKLSILWCTYLCSSIQL